MDPDAIKQPQDGAVSVFDGIVRINSRGRRTLCLEYTAYEEMASKQMESLAAEAMKNFDIRDVRMPHRLGRLEIGELLTLPPKDIELVMNLSSTFPSPTIIPIMLTLPVKVSPEEKPLSSDWWYKQIGGLGATLPLLAAGGGGLIPSMAAVVVQMVFS